ncbi:MAG: prepilin-type N-terminal cleavage/methylation domain-containing protein [Lachnospiraceae bacterium]|nr:prepilin-type N-terminal cleavage/methylation domain-containing protein [Lachnospiraceae bacterium]
MKDDNRGITLVEIIIIIALIGVLSGVFIGGMGYIPNSAARSLATSIKSAIGETRIKTMGKQETVLHIYKDASDGRYYKQMLYIENGAAKADQVEMIGKHHPIVTYTYEGTSGDVTSTLDSDGVYIGFNRTNGKEEIIPVPGVSGVNSVICKEIVVTGGGANCTITIVPATGKVSYDG